MEDRAIVVVHAAHTCLQMALAQQRADIHLSKAPLKELSTAIPLVLQTSFITPLINLAKTCVHLPMLLFNRIPSASVAFLAQLLNSEFSMDLVSTHAIHQ